MRDKDQLAKSKAQVLLTSHVDRCPATVDDTLRDAVHRACVERPRVPAQTPSTKDSRWSSRGPLPLT